MTIRERLASWQKPQFLSRLNLDRRLILLAFGLAAIILGLVGAAVFAHDPPDIGVTLAEVLPQVFPSPTPTATSTPTAKEWVARYLSEADQAWQGADVSAAITSLEQAYAIQPDDPLVADHLFVAEASLGLQLADQGDLSQALEHFQRALELSPNQDRILQARDMAQGYLDAEQLLEQDDPAAAVTKLETIYAINPGYLETATLLHHAHFNYGLALQSQGQLWAARDEYRRALQIIPDEPSAKAQLYEVDYMLATPTPTATYTPTPSPTPTATPIPVKKIVIDVSMQTFWAYENDQVKWEFICSTGRADSPTRRGVFAVQSKIDNAWGGAWSIWMPYWLGIYWAGGSENGIHALPINPDGSVLWSGYLGTPISFGCIVLDTYAAKLVYDWADIGTPVIIQD